MKPQLILASASPRRAELLRQIDLSFKQCPAEIIEERDTDEPASEFVARMAREKAEAVWSQLLDQNDEKALATWVLASDTAIAIDDAVLGKPDSFEHAQSMWRLMSGREHQVMTSLCLQSVDQRYETVSVNNVLFSAISDAQMQAYWQTGEPLDKAGAYAIQGRAAMWVESIRGSYSSIMGLPIFETANLLTKAGFNIWPVVEE